MKKIVTKFKKEEQFMIKERMRIKNIWGRDWGRGRGRGRGRGKGKGKGKGKG